MPTDYETTERSDSSRRITVDAFGRNVWVERHPDHADVLIIGGMAEKDVRAFAPDERTWPTDDPDAAFRAAVVTHEFFSCLRTVLGCE
jgi:hypothetical protein